MSNTNKAYRIRTDINSDVQYINIDMTQSYDKYDILSLEIKQSNSYRLMNSGTGIIVGRVLANEGFGIPNAKISVFLSYNKEDNIENSLRYHYMSTKDCDDDGIQYNLLPNHSDDECKQSIGSFPTKRYVLDNDDIIEVFDKYYKYTTRTNNSGDYMLYGVPTGTQTLHCDIDLSDIGVLSQRPSDMIYKGYNKNSFESPSKFKSSTNLNSLVQIITQDKSVYVYPFWGDTTDEPTGAAITRCDININYKFEPTCIFLGSIITDTGENAISKKCVPSKVGGKMSEMVTGAGTIEMIRKTINGGVEQISIEGNEVINEDGVWCYQIPMNLDYVMTDEYGNTVLSDNPSKGIPTRTRVRFRVTMHENPADGVAKKRARYLIPNNPRLNKADYPIFFKNKSVDYEFGTQTKDENYRDLMWNNVYTVKNYIPRLQKARLPNNLKFLGIKAVNHSNGKNPLPYNKLSIKFNFMYTFMCTLIKILVSLTGLINKVITSLGYFFLLFGREVFTWSDKINILGIGKLFFSFHGIDIDDLKDADENDWYYPHTHCGNKTGTTAIFCLMMKYYHDNSQGDYWGNIKCTRLFGAGEGGADVGGLGWWFLKIGLALSEGITLRGLCDNEDGNPLDITPGVNKQVVDLFNKGKFHDDIYPCISNSLGHINNNISELYNCVENQLAQENEVTSFNFFNDWVNGVLYMPLWFRKLKPKKTFFWGLIKTKGKDRWCDGNKEVKGVKTHLKLYSNCVMRREVEKDDESGFYTIKSLEDDFQTVNVEKSIADDESGIEMLIFNDESEKNCYGFKCHKYGRGQTRITDGIIIEKETMLGDKVYYYKPTVYTDIEQNLVTLFATDIVLLGSLNTCDLHGIPQFFKILEGTSYQMPPDLLSEDYEYISEAETDSVSNTDENEASLIDESTRKTEYTGADWGNLGVDQSNYFSHDIFKFEANENIYDNGGLFYGLTCFNSYTKPKSIINLERICEIGVSLDETQDLLKSKIVYDGEELVNGIDEDNEDLYTTLTPDGYISYDDIYNHDYRSMFATLNGNYLKTKINYETGLVEYDLTQVYLDNFDGSLYNIMAGGATQGNTYNNNTDVTGDKPNYSNNYKLEVADNNYINFRFGRYNKYEHLPNHNDSNIYYYVYDRVLTYTDGEKVTSSNKIPRYDNSFYFYFGLNIGKTAIDKFYSTYYADCSKNETYNNSVNVNITPNEWCDDVRGYIEIDSNMTPPLKLTLKNINEYEKYYYNSDDILYSKFKIGYNDENISGENVEYEHVDIKDNTNNLVNNIDSGDYMLEIIDVNGEVYTEKISFKNTNYITYDIDKYDFNLTNSDLIKKFTSEDTNMYFLHQMMKNDGTIVDVMPLNYTVLCNLNNNFDNLSKYGCYVYGEIHTDLKTNEKSFIPKVEGYTYNFNTNELKNSNGNTVYYRELHCVEYLDYSEYYVNNNKFVALDKYKIVKWDGDTIIGFKSENKYSSEYKTGYGEPKTNKLRALFYQNVANYTQQKFVNFNDDRNIQTININDINRKDKIINNNNIILRDIFGYIKLSNFSESDYKIRVEPTIDLNYFNGYECVVIGNDVKIDGYGHIGCKLDTADSKLNEFYIGLPFGNISYKITVTMLCGRDDAGAIKVSNNTSISYITVYEGDLKMYINGIDYSLIKNFKTGIIDNSINNFPFLLNDDVKTDIYGWNDVSNIGLTESGLSLYPIEFTGDNYNIINELAEALMKNKVNGYVQTTVYDWYDKYIIEENTWNELSDNYVLVKDKNGKKEGDDDYIPTYEGDIITKCNLINTIIDNRIKLTKKMMGSFRLNRNNSVLITVTGKSKSKPIKYLIVNNTMKQYRVN
jgi:hypothetical protein